jgi:MoaA/NifB/PqqE/SkfB family radical SAM enzyme
MANAIRNFFTWAKPLKQGVFHYRSGGMLEGHRVHLRVESNGSGLLIIDADKIIYLNQTAAEILKSLLDGMSDEEVVTNMRARYRVAKETIEEDVDGLKHTIKRFAEATDVDPVTYLSNEDIVLFTGGFSAPHRMDVILTYEENDLYRRFCTKPAAEVKVITFEQWKRVIEILWNIGVPHILFAGGEPTGYEHFVDLVRFAEEVGIVTGLLTNGKKLSDMHYTNTLVDAGLDHLQVTLQSQNPAIHNALSGEGTWEQTVKGLENALATPIYCVAHTTFTKKNNDDIKGLVSFLKSKGVYAFAGNALVEGNVIAEDGLALSTEEARVVMEELSLKTEEEGISFLWYGNEHIDTESQPSGMWEYSLCIEPNGDVTPCELEYTSFGNILQKEWKEIWRKSIQHSREKM